MKIIKGFVYNFIMIWVRLYMVIRKFIYAKFCFDREDNKIDNIFNYYKVMEYRPDKDYSYNVSNEFYGTSFVMKRYSGYKKKIKAVIEHGLPISTVNNTFEYRDNDLKTMLVSSENRRKILAELTNKNLIKIGPIIAYAESVLEEFDIQSVKNNLGKTLLVFPMHNIEEVQYQIADKEFIEYINNIKERFEFDTILVSVYFIDIKRGMHLKYIQKGFQIVTSGNRMSYDFLDCQKTLLQIADGVVCQGYSSALGYALYMNKPASLFFDKLKYINSHNEVGELELFYDEKENLEELFSEYTDCISEKQREYCNYIYGFEEVKTPSEIRDIFKNA